MKKLNQSALIIALCMLAACSKSGSSVAPTVPNLAQGPEVNGQIVPRGTTQLLPGPSDSTINVANLGKSADRFYVEVESALSPDAFTKAKANGGSAAVKEALVASMASLKKIGAIEITEKPEVGYLTFWLPYQRDMFSVLKQVKLPTETYINPLSYDVNSLKQIKEYTAQSLGFTPRGDSTGFSGLNMIHAPEFVALAEESMPGVKVDGSSVRVGITDTGITYNHPTFLDANGKNRIAYMKDFTQEGRMYFNPAAKFTATLTDETKNEFKVTADYYQTVKLPALPDPEAFKSITDKKFTVSDELKAILKNTTQYTVLFSLLREDVFQGGEDPVDINANGTLNDEIPALLVLDQNDPTNMRVYADFTAKYNFKTSVGVHNFNDSKETTKVFAELIGFDIEADALTKSDSEDEVSVISASIMGYDPGNHGTHVAGIAAGRKTIQNDPDDTLARGVAPNAQILLDRVCANNGGCNATTAIIDIVQNGKAEVVNMSLGGLSPFNDGYGVQETVVNRLSTLYNTQFMISAGNSGPGRQTVGSPSVAKTSLSIGAAASRAQIQRQYQWPGFGSIDPASPQDDEFMLYFSSRGPTAAGGFKPNISAPGTELSSVQLNAAPGGRAGLDIYWGTSMAAPTATGAYALLLDAIKKFNTLNPTSPLETDSAILRNVIITTARPFAQSQFSWMDEGTGMFDLVAAWKELLALRAEKFANGVTDSTGKKVNLEYEIYINTTNPNSGTAYNGTRPAQDMSGNKYPEFGTGFYLNPSDPGSTYTAYVGRHLSEKSAASREAGDLTVKLVTTKEEFALKVDFGKDAAWLKAGVLDTVDCAASQTSNLTLIGAGAKVAVAADGTGTLNPFSASTLKICVDRAKLASLGAGDHGALIYAYATDGTTTATVPSFIIPVSVTNPHQSLADSTAYDINSSAKSFQVDRNYVVIPKGVQAVRVTLESPEKKPNENCSSVILMSLEGNNVTPPVEDEATLQTTSCESTGAPIADPAKRTLVINRVHPNPGIWELNVMGSYRYPDSKYHLRVDYVMADTSVAKIEGDSSALNGSFDWKLKEGSLNVGPDSAKSTYVLNSLYHKEASQVAQDAQVIVGGPLGQFRSYPAGVKKVTITTGGSKGNDIDLDIIQCDDNQGNGCGLVGQSGGSTDEESASFAPKAGKFYVVRVTGYDIQDDGKFFSEETQTYADEKGTLDISSSGTGQSTVNYSFTPDQVAASKLLSNALVTSHDYQVIGLITLSTSDKVTVGAVPVKISI